MYVQGYRPLLDVELTFEISPCGDITGPKLPAKIQRSLKSLSGGAFGGITIAPDTFPHLTETLGGSFPNCVVSKGDTWKRTVDFKNQLWKTKLHNTFKYLGVKPGGGRNRVMIEISPKYTMTPQAGFLGMMKFTRQELDGKAEFDIHAGRLARSVLNTSLGLNLAGKYTFDVKSLVTLRLKK